MMKIEESNKLIAEFLGLKLTNIKAEDVWSTVEYLSDNPDSTLPCSVPIDNTLYFDKSYDWLMPVVERIESLGYDSRIIGNNSDSGFLCDFVDIENNEISCKVSYESKLEAVYKTVIEFIKWYNDQEGSI